MKNKSKLNKIKNQKHEVPKIPGEWLYFAPADVTVRKMMDSLQNQGYGLEIWEDAGVLEIEFLEGQTVDFEETQIHPKDEVTVAFARENRCDKVFLVTFVPENYSEVEKIMRKIQTEHGGVFCGDTENFEPVLR